MTRAMFIGLVGGLLLVLTGAHPARADVPKPSQPRVVLVGISEYADKQINSRPHAEDDAKALYDLFTDQDYLPGSDADHVKLLLGKEDAVRKSQPATKENILRALAWLQEAKQDDLTIFGFIGEGGSLGERGDRRCYFASNSTLKGRDKDAVDAAQVGEILDKLKSRHFCALLDLNFKGFTTKESIPEPDFRNSVYKEVVGDDGTDEHGGLPGRAVFLATAGLSTCLDLDKHDAFVQVALDGLKGAADKEGYEPDGVVTVDELADYLDKEMGEVVRTHGKTVKEKVSTNGVLGGRSNHFVLTHNPAVAAKVQARLDKLAALAKDKKVSADLAEEGRALLTQMPKLEAQRNLRKEYQQLVDGTLALDKFTEARDQILKSQQLKHSAAEAYARSVIRAAEELRDNYVKDVKEGDLVAWAVRGLYRRLDEKLPGDIADRLNNTKEMSEPQLTELLADARERLGKREDLENHKDVDISLQRMTGHLDPHTTYWDVEQKEREETQVKGEFTGIGIQIRKDAATDMLQVVTPIKGSPAYKAGMMAGDIITSVTREVDSDGKKLDPPEVLSTKGLLVSEAVNKILGKPRTKVRLTVQREGESQPLEFELTRSTIEVESVFGFKRKAEAEWDYTIDPENNIAYIRLDEFRLNTARDLKEVMKKLDKQGIKGLVLDLRFDPGGYLSTAREVADLFIEDGVIVTIRPRVGRPEVLLGRKPGSYLGFPMVCLINGDSASASEIVSACLQDHHRALIVGERSYGKGSVQNIAPFEGGALKMTIATFWRPNGKNLNKSSTKGTEDEDWGVRPDAGFVVDLSRKERLELYEHLRNAEIIPRPDWPVKETEFSDLQLDKALQYLRGQIKTAAQGGAKKEG
jgi:C-terminal peptidase prc